AELVDVEGDAVDIAVAEVDDHRIYRRPGGPDVHPPRRHRLAADVAERADALLHRRAGHVHLPIGGELGGQQPQVHRAGDERQTDVGRTEGIGDVEVDAAGRQE